MSLDSFNVTSLKKAFLAVCDLPDNENNLNLIDDSVFHTGGERPWESVLDLIQVYASNLLNSGLPGPLPDRFGRMTRWAVEQAGFVRADRLTEFSRVEFARQAAEHCAMFPLADSSRVDNTAILRAISQGGDSVDPRKTIVRLIDSTEQFCRYLLDRHGGSAESFSKPFVNCVRGLDARSRVDDAAIFRKRIIGELNFLLMGPATSPNFLKDSQIGRARQITNLADTYIGTLAKPDIHVMRFMLVLTGRVLVDRKEKLDQLTNLAGQELTELFVKEPPCEKAGWGLWPVGLSAEERCLRDLNFLAFCNNDAGIVVDRILYMVGAENDSSPIAPLRPSDKRERYEKFLRSLGLIAW
jgi:hypothetical protein